MTSSSTGGSSSGAANAAAPAGSQPTPGAKAARKFKITLFASETISRAIDTAEVPWAEFPDPFRTPVVTPCTVDRDGPGANPCVGALCDYKKGSAWSPASFQGNIRGKKNALSLSLVGFDVDQQNQEALDGVLARVRELGLAALMHGTHNDGRGKDGRPNGLRSVRFVFRPSREIAPGEWQAVVAGARALLGLEPDTATLDVSRLFFFPTRPKDAPEMELLMLEGDDLDVDRCTELGKAAGARVIETRMGALAAGAPVAPGQRSADDGFWDGGQEADPDLLEDARERLRRLGPAVMGEGGGKLAVVVGFILFNDYDLTWEDGWKLALEWNAGCRPPWGEDELDGEKNTLAQLLRNGMTYAEGVLGSARRDFALKRWGLRLASRAGGTGGSGDGSGGAAEAAGGREGGAGAGGAGPGENGGERGAEAAGRGSGGSGTSDSGVGRKIVRVTTDLEGTVEAAQGLLAADPDEGNRLYQHDGELCQVALDGRPGAGDVEDAPGADGTVVNLETLWGIQPRIRRAGVPSVQRRLSTMGRWIERVPGRSNQPPGEKDVLPPRVVCEAVLERGSWRVPRLERISTRPVMRPDGTVAWTPGYDASTGVYVAPSADLASLRLPERPTRGDAEAAYKTLMWPFQGFPWVSPWHEAIVAAAICTVACRPVVAAPVPFFSIEAPQPDSGKSLLVDAVSLIATGRVAARTTLREEEEEQKQISSQLFGRAEMVLVDNVSRPLGSEHWDSLGTTLLWSDRMMRTQEIRTVVAWAVWFFTGNNLVPRGDMSKRLARCMLDAKMVDPGSRKFDLDLLAYVRANRVSLLEAALVIVAAHRQAGSPVRRDQGAKYPEWSLWIRGAVEWASGVDPWAGRGTESSIGDAGADVGVRLAGAWLAAFGAGTAKTVAEAVGSTSLALQAVLGEYCAGRDGKVSSIKLGHRLTRLRGRVFEAYDGGDPIRFEMDAGDGKYNRWRLVRVKPADAPARQG